MSERATAPTPLLPPRIPEHRFEPLEDQLSVRRTHPSVIAALRWREVLDEAEEFMRYHEGTHLARPHNLLAAIRRGDLLASLRMLAELRAEHPLRSPEERARREQRNEQYRRSVAARRAGTPPQ